MPTQEEDRAKLNDLSARLASVEAHERHEEREQEEKRASSQGAGVGMRIGIELLGAVLAGAGIGYLIDSKLHTKPIFMLALIVLGFAAGVLDVLRVIKGLDQAVGLGRAVREKDARNAAGQNAPGFQDDDDD